MSRIERKDPGTELHVVPPSGGQRWPSFATLDHPPCGPANAGTPCPQSPITNRKSKILLFAFSALFVALLVFPLSHAYPPAPHQQFYGVVRNELGDPLNPHDAEVILETASGVRLTTPIVSGAPGLNYVLSVPMDSGLTADAYKPTALKPTVGFTFRVRIGATIYLPIEVKADYSLVGQPGKRTHLDLTLGEDLDGDGLPDAWERALLSAGQNLDGVTPGDDSDGDGLSNLDEYLAGTYAFDPKDSFELKIASASPNGAALEFTAIKGRTYRLLGSANMREWSEVPFQLLDGTSSPQLEYHASDVRKLLIEAKGPADSAYRFFRLIVR